MWEKLWVIAGLLCLLYYIGICLVMKKWNATFARFWLLGGITFIITGLTNCIAINIGLSVFAVVFIIIEIHILNAMFAKKVNGLPYIIVLGAKVNGTVVSESLKRRLDAAVEYLSENPKTRVIVSGSKLNGELITEAEAMMHYLLGQGIERKRIVKEENSYTTRQNLTFSRELIEDKEAAVGIVTSNYHIYRSLYYARRLGYKEAIGIPASCHPALFVNYMTREFFAIVKIWLTKGFTML